MLVISKGAHHDRERVTPQEIAADPFDSLGGLELESTHLHRFHRDDSLRRDDPAVPARPIVAVRVEHAAAVALEPSADETRP